MGTGGIVLTKRPTNAPTSTAESPAVLGGTVWYDANGDGRRNDPNSALTEQDFVVSEKERGSGVGNIRVLLRDCSNDADLGVSYTFPSGPNVNRGQAKVFDAEYLEEIQTQDYYSDAEGADMMTIGYFSFKILPNQIPGEFYVVFEAPMGYRLSGGSGLFWEVGMEAVEDKVVPMIDDKLNGRELQYDDDTAAANGANETIVNATTESTEANQITVSSRPTPKPTSYEGYLPKINNYIGSFDFERPIKNVSAIGPITHSGYFSRSRCIPVKKNQLIIDQIDAGMTISPWPLLSFQYASFILIFSYYEQSATDRKLQNLDCEVVIEEASLECRLYQKMKCDGIAIADEWGCETPLITGPLFTVEELTLEEGDVVVDIVKEFLSLGSGEFTLTNAGLTHQYVELLDQGEDQGVDRRLLDGQSDNRLGKNVSLRRKENIHNNRHLQNEEIARLELGFRIRGESEAPSEQELTNILLQSIADDTDTLLSTFKTKTGLPEYMRYAGEISTRRVLDVPKPEKITVDVISSVEESVTDANMPAEGIIGIVIGIMLLGIFSGLLVYRRMKDDDDSESDSSDSSDYSSSDDDKLRAKKVVKKQVIQQREYNSDDSDSLSSRWYSDYEGSDAEEKNEHFDVKSAFYSGFIRPKTRPSMSARSAGSSRNSRRSNLSSMQSSRRSNESSMKSSPRSYTSSRTGGSSRASGRISTGMSRVSSAVSHGTQSAASSVMSADSRRRFSSEFSKSTRSTYPSKTSSSLLTGQSRSTRSSYPSRTSQSTRSNASSRPSYSRYSQASSTSSQNASRASRSFASMETRSRESQTTGSPSLQDSMITTSTDGSRSQR